MRLLLRRLYFNPRSPWGERLHQTWSEPESLRISIHAPRGGSDLPLSQCRCKGGDFNPRSPWGERLLLLCIPFHPLDFNPRSPWGERPVQPPAVARCVLFQSTLPVGGATSPGFCDTPGRCISIHAPRGGSDLLLQKIERAVGGISIHAPRGGSDFFQIVGAWGAEHFNPRSPWGERQDG